MLFGCMVYTIVMSSVKAHCVVYVFSITFVNEHCVVYKSLMTLPRQNIREEILYGL
jgi:hypothetical protein